jgi:hypothetical protein
MAKPTQTTKLLDLLKRNKWEVTGSCGHQDNPWPRNTLEDLLWIEWFFKIVRIKQLFLKSKIVGHGLWNTPQRRSKLKPISFSTLSYQILYVDMTQSSQKKDTHILCMNPFWFNHHLSVTYSAYEYSKNTMKAKPLLLLAMFALMSTPSNPIWPILNTWNGIYFWGKHTYYPIFYLLKLS